MIKGKKGFTLAEVLITLGIIGVVAAMTIPTLIANTNGAKFRSQFKKTLSTLNQAVRSNVAQYDFDFSMVQNCGNKDTDNPENIPSICAMLNGSLTGKQAYKYDTLKTIDKKDYFQVVFDGTAPDTLIGNKGVELYMYQLSDGSIFAFHSPMEGQSGDVACTLDGKNIEEALKSEQFQKFCVGFIDVNGTTKPNKEVKCSDGKSHSKDINENCVVPNNPKFMGDVFPVAYYDMTIVPASAASRYILNSAK